MNTLPVTAPRIDIANPLDVLGWAERFDVPADVLREVMVQVGDDAEAVALVLKGSVTACRPH